MAVDMKDISEILIGLTGGNEPTCTIKEIAFVMGVHVQTVYAYRSGQNEPLWRDVVRLSHHLIKEYGYYELAMQPTMICKSGRTNGRVNDELLSLLESSTDLHRAFQSKNGADFWNAFNQMKKELEVLKEEGAKI